MDLYVILLEIFRSDLQFSYVGGQEGLLTCSTSASHMSEVKQKRLRFGEYGIILFIAVLGILGILYFGGFVQLGWEFYVGIILGSEGVYTIFFVFSHRSQIRREDRNYMFMWGYVLAALGFALFVDIFTKNLLLNISVAVLIGAILGALNIKYAGR